LPEGDVPASDGAGLSKSATSRRFVALSAARMRAQWVPRGDVLRCIIDDGGLDGEVVIHIDDQELSLREFGRLLRVHAGWGMRIAFVPEEFVTDNPTVKIRKPQKRKR